MKKIILTLLICAITSCGYQLRANNKLAESYSVLTVQVPSGSLLKRSLSNALLSSGIVLESENKQDVTVLNVTKDNLRKIVQSIGTNNQVQEYRLEYEVEYSIADGEVKTIYLERDYSFDVQQIGGGQQEELTLRKQLAEDMAWAIIRQINLSLK
ncbi:MAG: LPS assembly lipoprotein LptE [Proteobacteria bacterium]|nr:LPS assembly lipoprotein LptE [Pseudomonadota bacterium]